MVEVNAKGLTHHEHMERYVTHQKCTASDMTFGARCLNCGWVADVIETAKKNASAVHIEIWLPRAPEEKK
jgi:hypothetical protein